MFNTSAPSSAALILAGCLYLTGCGPSLPIIPGENDDDSSGAEIVPEHLIVVAEIGTERSDLLDLFDSAQTTVQDELPGISGFLLETDPADRDEARSLLTDSELVEGVADNRVYAASGLPDDLLYREQWHLGAVGADDAWDVTTGSDRIVVAVLDTGVDGAHLDLADKLLEGLNTYDESGGWSDAHGHGTAVAGIIAAEADNRQGVASLAWGSPILPVRVTSDEGKTSSWALAAGIRAALDEGAQVINVSFAPLQRDLIVLRQAYLARLAGRLVFISSGNDGKEATGGGTTAAIFVGAVDRDDKAASFSTTGRFVDLAAPGVGVYTTKRNDRYGGFSGTSAAAPVAAGVAALVWAVNPDLSPITVEKILTTTAKDLGPVGVDSVYGAGRVDARAAVQAAQEVVEEGDDEPPTISITAPADGESVTGRVRVYAKASDRAGIAEVALSVDGEPLSADLIPPYRFSLNTTKYAAGEHEVTVTATDTSGNTEETSIALVFAGQSDTRRPMVTLTAPADGATVRGLVTILAEVSDDRSLDHADILVDGEVIATIPLPATKEATVAYNWNTQKVGEGLGRRSLAIRVYDASGNWGSVEVDVIVK